MIVLLAFYVVIYLFYVCRGLKSVKRDWCLYQSDDIEKMGDVLLSLLIPLLWPIFIFINIIIMGTDKWL